MSRKQGTELLRHVLSLQPWILHAPFYVLHSVNKSHKCTTFFTHSFFFYSPQVNGKNCLLECVNISIFLYLYLETHTRTKAYIYIVEVKVITKPFSVSTHCFHRYLNTRCLPRFEHE